VLYALQTNLYVLLESASMKNIVILISGRGSNMEAIIDASKREGWPAKIAGVISDRPQAAGLAYASAQGIPVAVVPAHAYTDRLDFDQALIAAIERFSPDVVVLAGFMRVLGEPFVTHYAGRLLNVHPSLLPVFKGLHTHQRALDAGVKVHGVTVHFVTAVLDDGPIVGQAVVPVLQGDTALTLGQRVLAAEHILYPRIIRLLVEEKIKWVGNQAIVQDAATPLYLFMDSLEKLAHTTQDASEKVSFIQSEKW
jgi:phosphoribosylglycinamide formyltransferase-1